MRADPTNKWKAQHSDAAEGYRLDPAASRGRGAALQGKAGLIMKTRDKKIRAEAGGGNVFADLDLPHADQELLKARLTLQIHKPITARGLTQTEAGTVHRLKQPHICELQRNRSGEVSDQRPP